VSYDVYMTHILVETAHTLGATSVQHLAGSIVVVPGETPKDCFVIEKGSIRQYDIRDNGTELTLNIYKEGSVLTLPWLFHSSPNLHFFQCISDCVLLRTPRLKLLQEFKKSPELSFETLSRVANGLDGVLNRLSAHSSTGAAQVIMTELSIEATRFGRPHPEGIFVRMRVQDLANRTGLARETVSRTLTDLISKALILRVTGGYLLQKHT
jgi:CRP-like cAMP-binding protein